MKILMKQKILDFLLEHNFRYRQGLVYMNNIKYYFILSLALLMLTPQMAFSAEMVVVDMQQLEVMSVAGKALRERITAERNALKAVVEKEGKALKEEEAKIISSKKNLSEVAFKDRVKGFEVSFKNKQAKIEKKREAFEKSALEAHAKLRKEVVSVVGALATEKKHKLVLSRQAVVIVEKSMDITAEVMERLNAKVKSIPFK